jgi:5-methylcytosine-specific restriction protein A
MPVSRISGLTDTITAAKVDWLPGTSWMGFTPPSEAPNAFAQCQSTINRQIGKGLVIEYITLTFPDPNPGHETDPEYLAEKETHAAAAGRLVGVHRLRPSARRLRTILGDVEYEKLQDRWAEDGKRRRWSVAFPIIESYDIQTKPRANMVFSAGSMRRLFAHPSGTLRPLNDFERSEIADLPLTPRPAVNAWIAIEDEIATAERSPLPEDVVRLINEDLTDSALEGMPEDRRAKIRRRAAWLANRFVMERRNAGALHCDRCPFNPAIQLAGSPIKPRSVLDVHHKHPLEEGLRRTTLADFELLCPTCHRVEHLLLGVQAR